MKFAAKGAFIALFNPVPDPFIENPHFGTSLAPLLIW